MQMPREPLVSLIMPAYNAERHLRAAIASVKAQSWRNWQLIAVNDGSTDRTPEILEAERDPRILVLHQPNGGVSTARNTALDHAQGAYLAFFDADDLLPTESLAARARLLLNDEGLLFADGAVLAFGDDPQKALPLYCPAYAGVPFDALVAMDGSCFFGNTWMIRRSPATDLRFPVHMRHAEELAYYFSMARAGRYGGTSEPVLLYRRGPATAMTDLHGLGLGYQQLHGFVRRLPQPPSPAQLARMRRRIRSVMAKSHAKQMDLPGALRSLVMPFP
jgi:teichuronic acid biosynthesis glycosyltransferase TuaG